MCRRGSFIINILIHKQTAINKEETEDDGVLVEMVDTPEDSSSPPTTNEHVKDELDEPIFDDDDEQPATTDLTSANLDEHNKDTKATSGEDTTTDEEVETGVGAGVLFAVPGLIVGGPLLGLLSGVGAFFVATKDHESPAGDVARNAGKFAVETGSNVGHVAKEVDQEHHIMDKIKEGWSNLTSKVQQIDEENKISEKVSVKASVAKDRAVETASVVKERAIAFEQKHHFGLISMVAIMKTAETIQTFASNIIEKMKGGDESSEVETQIDEDVVS